MGLYFFYGTMKSGKSAQALLQYYKCCDCVNHTTMTAGKGNPSTMGDSSIAGNASCWNVFLLKPSTDTRSKNVVSRAGLSVPCTLLPPDQSVFNYRKIGISLLNFSQVQKYVIVDEAQFLTPKQVEEFRLLANDPLFEVYCYGLKTNYKTHLFPGAQRLIELADHIEEIPCPCAKCGDKAIINTLFSEGLIQEEGEEVHIGDAEYVPLCHDCYSKMLRQQKHEKLPKFYVSSMLYPEEDSKENTEMDTQEKAESLIDAKADTTTNTCACTVYITGRDASGPHTSGPHRKYSVKILKEQKKPQDTATVSPAAQTTNGDEWVKNWLTEKWLRKRVQDEHC